MNDGIPDSDRESSSFLLRLYILDSRFRENGTHKTFDIANIPPRAGYLLFGTYTFSVIPDMIPDFSRTDPVP